MEANSRRAYGFGSGKERRPQLEDKFTESKNTQEEEKMISKVEELLHYAAMKLKLKDLFAKHDASLDEFLRVASMNTGINKDNIIVTVSCAYESLDDEEAYREMPKDEPHFSDTLIKILSLVGKEIR